MRGSSFLAVLLILVGIVMMIAGTRARAAQLIQLLKVK